MADRRTRRRFTNEFKAQAVKRVLESVRGPFLERTLDC
jgi:transposase-like protein